MATMTPQELQEAVKNKKIELSKLLEELEVSDQKERNYGLQEEKISVQEVEIDKLKKANAKLLDLKNVKDLVQLKEWATLLRRHVTTYEHLTDAELLELAGIIDAI